MMSSTFSISNFHTVIYQQRYSTETKEKTMHHNLQLSHVAEELKTEMKGPKEVALLYHEQRR